ncbi:MULTISPECIES: thioredoxin family protein [Thiomicrorhabdus]|uniref:Thioredoxin family protein n=1 Tax=Thiomicrorhabdus xiamenensis TaxID=2739063 RepID=A0A7D4TDZ2_9GAMM|nr:MULTISPECIES: thioredoxin family protein [Thiomicrorhabdus]MBO1924139.1 thioredoxin family protein [Thiomicrorhabdus sp. 6S3-12]QKI88987.1 thioredoxin family protein [Thiomicrorhabdus xiamenensis]
MLNIETCEELQNLKQQSEALLVLYGGSECNVCHAIKPMLIDQISEHYPKMQMAYIDCHKTTEVCSQEGIFSLPVVQVYFTGQKFIEEVRSFSLQKLRDDIQRPYQMLFSEA